MADNTRFQESTDPAQPKILDKEVAHSGDLAKLQYIGLGITTGTEGAYTFRELAALDTLLQSLVTGQSSAQTTLTALLAAVDGLETQLQATLTLNAPATATAIASGTADSAVLAATTNLRLLGFTIKETAATPGDAEVILRHGTSVAGTPVAQINLAPNESVRDWFGPGGIIASGGLFLDRVSGTTEITVFTVVAA